MPISFACPCGRQLRAGDDLAGKRVKCPDCGKAVTVPGGFEVIEDDEPAKPRKKTKRPGGGPLARKYAEEAERQKKLDAAMGRMAGASDNRSQNYFARRMQPSIYGGASMIVTGLPAVAALTIWRDKWQVTPMTYYVAIGITLMGVIALVRGLVWGSVED